MTLKSEPVQFQSFDCSSLLDELEKGTAVEFPKPSGGGSSSSSGSISVSASKCIVYNRYSYCELKFVPKISGVSVKKYKIYRCAKMSNSLSRPSKSDFSYIGSETYTTYVDGGVCNQYFWKNESSSGTYYWDMYYYVEAVCSDGTVYTSGIVKAD